jgi:hypothetical protein
MKPQWPVQHADTGPGSLLALVDAVTLQAAIDGWKH